MDVCNQRSQEAVSAAAIAINLDIQKVGPMAGLSRKAVIGLVSTTRAQR